MNETPFRPDEDRARLLALARLCPAENVHVIDLPYRLASWALDSPDNVALWSDAAGRLLAWAVLQTPFWNLDVCLHPDAPAGAYATALAWAAARMGQLPEGRRRPAWFVPVLARQTARRRALEAAGWVDQGQGADDEPWSQVICRRDGQEPAPRVALRPGFAIRPLDDSEAPDYVALHRAVFESENMTEGWRVATMAAPGRRPAFDLVATGPDGALAGFAVGWWGEVDGRAVAQVEPFGVRADARRYGVAWALMFELLRRFQEAGAAEVLVLTDRYRDAANAFYQGCGFVPAEDVRIYRRDCAGDTLYNPGS